MAKHVQSRIARCLIVATAFWVEGATAYAQNPVIDLKNAPVGHKLAGFLHDFAQGNERNAGVNSLSMNRMTGDIQGNVWVRHRQVAGHTPRVWNPNPFHPGWAGGDPIVVYDDTQTADFAFDLRTGSGHFVLDLGHGVKLDTSRIQGMLQGDLNDYLEIAFPGGGGLVEKRFRDEYQEIRNSYAQRWGPSNIYFASKRFTDWASPETAGDWVITAIATGGSAAVAQAMQQSEQQASQEAPEIIAWLESKGIAEARDVVAQILSGGRVEWPFLAVKWQTVGYFSWTEAAGRAVTPQIRSTHAAFVIIWQDQPGGGAGQGQGRGGPQYTFDAGALKLVNHTGEPLEVWIQYKSRGEWIPGPPGAPQRSYETINLAPGEETYLNDGLRNNARIEPSEFFIRAQSPSNRLWADNWEQPVMTVNPNTEGQRIYTAPAMGTYAFTFN
ncbi:MAG: hypothetical protein ACLQU5_15115 [Isosphaeraceae bacterium]